MTDETTARDRLVMKIAVAASATHAEATEIVDWLQANSEVLCALAGAPTADVAAVNGDEQLALQEDIHEAQHAVHGTCCIDQDDATSCELLADVLSRRGWRRAAPAVEPEGMDAAAEQGASRCPVCEEPLRRCCYVCPAGPHDDGCEGVQDEGMDGASELHLRLRHVLGIDDDVIVSDDGLINDVGEWVRRAHAFGADVPAVEPEGVDVEAQGEMADELTAIERLAGWVNGGQYDAATLRTDVRGVLRALTGLRGSTHSVGLALGLAPLSHVPIDGKAALGRVREVAAELTAAQAAIQRVRAQHVVDGRRSCEGCAVPWPCPTVRALDGDTTEEQR